ncbi:hypothetical protein OAK50_02825 [Verrucomicrobiales bacterium]|jgi:hypothetical protein|nr:hypothetical protein [Verrucomicrobiales bacterium]MDC0263203.1 hypothetical protein [Verrucomicrobiales bacterium]
MKKFISTVFSAAILVALTNLSITVEESNFGFGDNVGGVQFNDESIIAVFNQFSRSESSSSAASSNQFIGEFELQFIPNEQKANSIMINHKRFVENTERQTRDFP